MTVKPQPLAMLPSEQLRSVRFILTDFDDTLTLHGRLPSDTVNALYALEELGIQVIPVTGGCAGWSDMVVRTLPVAGVVSEGGGVFLQRQGKQIHYHFFDHETHMRVEQERILESVLERLPEYPSLRLTRDQSYRLTDVAIDYAQEIQPPATAEKNALLAELKGMGFNAKASSIHINICQIGVDKFAMSQRVLQEFFGLAKTEFSSDVIYVGDAPNDESMFAQFPLSIGVANIEPHLAFLKHVPAYITTSPGGLGFAELANVVLASVQKA